MSYYPGGGHRQGGDPYRPQESRGHGYNNGGYASSRGRQQYDSRGSQYRPGQGRGSYQGNRQPRYNPSRQGASHLVYTQTQTENQLWMGDLDPLWNEDTIMKIWRNAGESPTNVKIMRDRVGKPLYCFVTFASPQEVLAALQKNQTPVPGYNRLFKLNYASRNEQFGGYQRGLPGSKGSMPNNEWSVFVGDLAPEITEPMLFNHFLKEYPGAVRNVKIMMDFSTKTSKGFGFVRFNNEESQKHALQNMSESILAGKPIRVSHASRSDTPTADPKKTEMTVPSSVKLSQSHPPLGPFTDPYNTVIKVKGITRSITRDELLGHFLPFGHIVYCRMNYKNGFAHIKYLLRRDAESAMHFMYGFIINNNPVALRWGREERTDTGKVGFHPVEMSDTYHAASKAPLLLGDLPSNVVFEDLDKDQVDALQLHTQNEFLTVAEYDAIEEQKKKERDDYLMLAF